MLKYINIRKKIHKKAGVTYIMKTDIDMTQEATHKPIQSIAENLGLNNDDWEPYGHTKAKLTHDLMETRKDANDGKVILVTSINPTPAGEGKSTVTVGLGQALNKIEDRKSVV